MPIAVEVTVHAITVIVQTVPIGTNIGLVRILWVMLSGSFLQSRGAIFGALAGRGFTPQEVRRSWAALRSGVWEINELIDNWQLYVASENQWHVRRHERYQAVGVDMTGFWRPRLKGWVGKHFHSLAGRALPAVVFGVIAIAGEVNHHRIPLLRRVVRCKQDMGKVAFRSQLLKEAVEHITPNQVVVVDAEFEIAELQAANVREYVVRMATNCTALRNQLPTYKDIGRRPKYGEKVRPLPRKWQDREIAATAPDHQALFDQGGRQIQASSWHDLVLPGTPVAPDAATFSIYVFHDPLYKHPLVLATNLVKVQPETVFRIYLDRWPVEQPPLAAKQMIGLHRQFVFAVASCFRLPELNLLAGAILTYLAAVLPPVPSGFWDRTPKPTPGRLRRLLAQADFPTFVDADLQLRKKNSVTAHLPKGIDAHRRTAGAT
jgi:hypothetical protein